MLFSGVHIHNSICSVSRKLTVYAQSVAPTQRTTYSVQKRIDTRPKTVKMQLLNASKFTENHGFRGISQKCAYFVEDDVKP